MKILQFTKLYERKMSFNNVIVSCIQNSLDEMNLEKYKNVDIYDDKELKV